MTLEKINEIRERYVNRTSKNNLSKYYWITLKEVYEITKGLKMNPRKTSHFNIAKEKKEDIIMMYLNDFKKVDIEAKTGVSSYFVTTFINELERQTTPRKSIDDNLEAIRRQEAKVIEMAENLANGKGSETRYKVLLSVHASAEPFNGGVFEV